MKRRALTAIAVDAGIYPDTVIYRTDNLSRRIYGHPKGGWIELIWEFDMAHRHSPQKIAERVATIQVSKARALQAMAALAAGDKHV